MSLLHLVGHDATNHGEDALALARTLGQGRDVRRTVVHVLPQTGPTTVLAEAALAALLPVERELTERVGGALLFDEALEVVFASSPARGLHDRAEALGAELVIVGARSERVLGRELAPVTNRLLAGGPCAVAHAPAGYVAAAHAFQRILVGYDGSDEARGALVEAARLAAASGALVDVVSAHDELLGLGYPGAIYVLPEEPIAADERAAALARSGLELLPEGARGASVGRRGEAGRVIAACALSHHADLVVLGSRGYGPLRRALLGSTGSSLLHHGEVPVLLLPRSAHATVPEVAHGFAVAP